MKKSYDDDFKKMITDLIFNKTKTATEIVNEYGLSRSVLYKWINMYKPVKSSDGKVTNNKEIIGLKKELARTQMELEILKKTIAILTPR